MRPESGNRLCIEEWRLVVKEGGNYLMYVTGSTATLRVSFLACFLGGHAWALAEAWPSRLLVLSRTHGPLSAESHHCWPRPFSSSVLPVRQLSRLRTHAERTRALDVSSVACRRSLAKDGNVTAGSSASLEGGRRNEAVV